MAKLQYFNGNGGFWAINEFEDYSIGALTGNTRTLTFDGDFDPTQYAFRIVLTYANLTTTVAQTGEFSGRPIITGGTLASISYFDQAGQKIAELNDLKGISAALFDMYIRLDRSFEAYNLAIGSGLTVTGSSNSSIEQRDWTGDDIQTGLGNDVVNAGGGDDFISDRGGRDTYNGGSGFDTVSYEDSFWETGRSGRGINADLTKGTVRGPDGPTDKLVSIEGIRGSYMNDVMKGNTKANEFMGLAGNDTIDGGAGSDWVFYFNDGRENRGGGIRGVEVELQDGRSAGFAIDGWGTRDRLISIENVEGSDLNDKITGNAAANELGGSNGNDQLLGRGGNDYLDGDNGNDTITGGTGNDQMNGGLGNDVFVFANGTNGQDWIEDFVVGTDRLQITGLTEVQAVAAVELVNLEGEVLVDFNSGTATILLNNVAFGSVTKAELFSFG